jgi:phosphoglucosamine mutase
VGRLFGTDGVRGTANADLTPELALALSVAAAHVLAELDARAGHRHRPLAVVGRDGRASGEFLQGAVVAGLASAGADVLLAGVVPTPAVAYLTGALGADLGVVLSASHNAMPDNGIKFFARGGTKLPDAVEDAVEARMTEAWTRPTGADVGRVRELPDATERYVAQLAATVPHRLDGLRVVVDCAHGAAYAAAPAAYRAAGADVIAIGAEPDGLNINSGCGSTHPEGLMAAVRAHAADVGLAHDGDADRCLAVDAAGELVDGDAILAILALGMRAAGTLRRNTVVTTVMTNLGFKLAMRREGLEVLETPVGDRYVLEEMLRLGLSLGGEQSGHVIMLDHAPTGDGTLTGLHLLARMAATGKPLAELATVMERLPQVLINIPVQDKARVGASPAVAAAVAAAKAELAAAGRVLVRPSGTESLVRVMVEAATSEQAQSVAERIATGVRTA